MITVFGSINLDLIGGVERLPRPGETVPGVSFVTAPGGKGANQALAAARAGAAVRMVGAVGRDGFADPALALLNASGVDLARVTRASEPTGVALILVDGAGENVIAVIPGANGTLAAADAEALDFGPDDMLLLQLEVPLAAMMAAARRARASGAPVILNAAPFRREALALLPHLTHLVVNETECALIAEAAGLSGGAVEAEAAALAEKHAVTTIVTLGADGVLAISDGRSERAAALAVKAVDTVGAGDTFCGYLAAALVEGRALADALGVASAAASLACTKSGAQPSIPRREEVDAALRAGAR
ncbi:MAG TPA: ribokinase [Propylenella sp.]